MAEAYGEELARWGPGIMLRRLARPLNALLSAFLGTFSLTWLLFSTIFIHHEGTDALFISDSREETAGP
jgi:hypothetical protein